MEISAGQAEKIRNGDTVAVFVARESAGSPGSGLPPFVQAAIVRIKTGAFEGKQGEILYLPLLDSPNLIICGIGKQKEVNAESLRNSMMPLAALCRKRNISSLIAIPPVLESMDRKTAAGAIAEGIALSSYSFSRYKSKKKDEKPLASLRILTDSSPEIDSLIAEIIITASNTLLCRDLVNEVSDKSNPLAVSAIAKKLASLRGVNCRVFGKREIEKMKMGLFLAVSRGSVYPPQLVVLSYRGNPKSGKFTALVGKGITFDSGGLNLKPSGNIESMRSDMAGAAACIYAFKSIAELRLKKNVYAVIPLCENMLSEKSYKPGDVFIAYNGKSVEIGNTDAEGRLILADALAFTEQKLKPDCIIDIATLTGASIISLGEFVAAILSTDDHISDTLFRAGEKTGDRVWRMPLYREYVDDIKSDFADIVNVSSSRKAGTIIGAVFLRNFISKTPWAHIDSAGTSWYTKARGYRPKYATGFGVRLLVETVKNLDY